jgi:hypothetical protein
MILKGSQRANGSDLATHLMNEFDNEYAALAELRGTVAEDLHGAFAEFEAVALGTRMTQPLYSLSINPPSKLTRDQYMAAIDTIEQRLGLAGQPRAVVFHVKDGREHAHVVWSRTNTETMRAIHMSHDRRRLCDLACDLAQRYGLSLPPGLEAWKAKQAQDRRKIEPTLAEKAQAEATGLTPEQRREEITAAYKAADNAAAFRQALEDKGYILARGDRRGFVVVDGHGDVHSLSRYVEGASAKDIRAKLKDLSADDLPSVDAAKEQAAQRAQAAADRAAEGLAQAETAKADAEQARQREDKDDAQRLRRIQEARRLKVAQAEQEMLTRQAEERMQLSAAQAAESHGTLFRLRSAVAELIAGTPGLRSVLGPLQRLTGLDPKERHGRERDALARRHAREKRGTERQRHSLKKVEARENASLRRRQRRRAAEAADAALAAVKAAEMRKSWKTDRSLLEEDGLGQRFNTEAADEQAVQKTAGDGADGREAPSWKDRAEKLGKSRKNGKGYRRSRDV